MSATLRDAIITTALMFAVSIPLILLAASNEAALAKCMETHSRGVCEHTLR